MPKKCVWECDKKGAILCTIFENLKQSLFRGAGWLGLLSALCGPTATSTPFRVLISYRFVRPCREEGGEDCDRSHFPHLHNYDPLPHILSKIGKGFAPTEEPCSVANSISLLIWCLGVWYVLHRRQVISTEQIISSSICRGALVLVLSLVFSLSVNINVSNGFEYPDPRMRAIQCTSYTIVNSAQVTLYEPCMDEAT